MATTIDTGRLGKLLALAGSGHDGEALAALRKAQALLKAAGLSFTDVAEQVKGAPTVQFEQAPRHASRPAQPTGYTDEAGVRWNSRADYERHCAQWEIWREADKKRHGPARAAVLERYGSAVAAIARDEREQALHLAALPWLEGPYAPDAGYEHLAARWHESMGGWKRYAFGAHPVDACRAAIEAAIPLPVTVRQARDELRYWDRRNDELCHALEIWGDEQLDLPAAYRRQMVLELYRTGLPIVTLDDLFVRLEQAAEADDAHDVCRAAPSNLDAFIRLVLHPRQDAKSQADFDTVQSGRAPRASDRRVHVLAMLSNSDTAAWSDRAIAKAAGVSPTTVGTLRRQVSANKSNNI